MMRIEITVDDFKLREGLRRPPENIVARALNRSMVWVHTRTVRAVAADLGVPQRRIDDRILLSPATPGRLTAVINVTGRRIPLVEFGARETARGVTYRIGGQGRSLADRAFIATMKSGHRGVFRRLTAAGPLPKVGKRAERQRAARLMVGRLPIYELFGPSVPRVAVETRIHDRVREAAATVFPKNLEHEMNFARGGAS